MANSNDLLISASMPRCCTSSCHTPAFLCQYSHTPSTCFGTKGRALLVESGHVNFLIFVYIFHWTEFAHIELIRPIYSHEDVWNASNNDSQTMPVKLHEGSGTMSQRWLYDAEENVFSGATPLTSPANNVSGGATVLRNHATAHHKPSLVKSMAPDSIHTHATM